jgi:chromosome segregation ATPase
VSQTEVAAAVAEERSDCELRAEDARGEANAECESRIEEWRSALEEANAQIEELNSSIASARVYIGESDEDMEFALSRLETGDTVDEPE